MAIPPPPDHGPFPGVPDGDMDDIQIMDPLDDLDDRGGGGGSKKKNKKDKDISNSNGTQPSRPVYEGCMLERLKPVTGEKLSWRRCGRRWLPYTQDELVSVVKKYRKLTRTTSADPDFKRLSGDKQGIINRIIEEKRLYEKSKTAEWTLVHVEPIERRGWSKEIVRLRIVIKRTDKGSDKNSYAAMGTTSYPPDDVIDLSIPLEKKKDKSKDKDKKNKRPIDPYDPLDDPVNTGYGLNDLPPRDDRHNYGPYSDPHGQVDDLPDRPPPPAPIAPEWLPPPPQHNNTFDARAPYPLDPHPNFAGGARDIPSHNPFYPQHHVAAPGQYDESLDARHYIHPHHGGRARTRSADRDRHRERSRSHRRQSLARRPSRRGNSRRRDSRRRDDSVEDMRHEFDRMYPDDRDSSSSNYDEHSLWSRSDSGGGRYGYSPDTSVYSEDYIPRNRSKPYHRDSDPRPRYRSSRYRDADIEPGYTYRNRDSGHRRYSSRDLDRRPELQRTITYDDYPVGRGAEPRFLPASPMQRRNTEIFGDKRNDYFDRELRNDWRQPVDREADAFEAGMRAARRGSNYYP